MSIDSLFLEDGWLSYLLDESDYSILLESSTEVTATASIFTYGFGLEGTSSKLPTYGFNIPIYENSGYLDQRFSTYFLYLENGDLIELEDDAEFSVLMVEFTDGAIDDKRLTSHVVSNGELTDFPQSFSMNLQNLSCASYGQSNHAFGYLDSYTSPNMPVVGCDISANLTFFGNVNKTLSPVIGSSIIGDVNNNFGFGQSLNLNSLSVVATGVLVPPNYGYFYNYIY